MLSYATERLSAELPGQLLKNPRLALRVLGIAKELQLDWLTTMCLEALEQPEEPHFCLQLASGELDGESKVRQCMTLHKLQTIMFLMSQAVLPKVARPGAMCFT
jgi:hypothetical protein